MRIPRGVRRVFRLPTTRERLVRELDDEVRFHIETRVERLVARGMVRDDAYAEAMRRFGDVDELRSYCQTIEVTHMQRMELRERIGGLAQDLRYALRQIHKAPAFSAIAALTLALGIGATTSIFSVVSGVLLKPLPFREPDRIVQLLGQDAKGNLQGRYTDPTFDDVAAQSHSFSALAEYQFGVSTIQVGGEAYPLKTASVSRGYFDVFGLTPAAGRFFAPDEQVLNASPAAVISYDFWQRQFGGAKSAIGASLFRGSQRLIIVGVLPPHLEYPAGVDVLTPRETRPKSTSRTAYNWLAVARLAPGVSLPKAQVDLSTILKRLKATYGDYTWTSDGTVVPLRDRIVGPIKPMLLLILAASLVLLLIACANVANLLVARMASREGEIAVRLALGAGRGRLAQQLLAESSILALLGCVGGLAFTLLGVKLLLLLKPASIPRVDDIGIDWRVLTFAVAASAVMALVLGLVAAWRAVRGDLRSALANAQRTKGGGASYRLRGTLVVAQLAMTMVLLAGAAVLGRSFLHLMSVQPGFNTRGVVFATALLPQSTDDSTRTARRGQYLQGALAQLGALPGVTAAGAADGELLNGGSSTGSFLVLDNAAVKIRMDDLERLFQDKTRTGTAEYWLATPGYFKAMGIQVVRGRMLDDRDRAGAPHAAVVSASLAQKQWPGQDPIGKVIEFGNMDGDLTPITIVGVVADVRDRSLSAEPFPAVYASYAQRPGNSSSLTFAIATTAPASTIASARRLLHDLRPDIPVHLQRVEDVVASSVSYQRFLLLLVGVFGLVSLLLAALGVYSVIAYLVAQRTPELGIRVALGARSLDVVRLVVAQGLTLVITGAVVGTAGAVFATRLLKTMVYETSTTDPVGFAVVIALLCVIAVIASWIPARRAAQIDPMDALRAG